MSSKQKTDRLDILLELIQSLTKAEKRQFKLFSKGNKEGQRAKFILLFNQIEKMSIYDEDVIYQKIPSLLPHQLSNTKSYLYKQILLSLRSFRNREGITMQIKDMIDNAQLLFDKCLYKQSKKIINKARILAEENEKHFLLNEILFLEKQLIEKLIEHGMKSSANQIIHVSNHHITQLSKLLTIQNVSLRLYALYMQEGFVKNLKGYHTVEKFFSQSVSIIDVNELDNTQKYHYYSCLVRYHFFVQETDEALNFAQKNYQLFQDKEKLKFAHPEFYIKSHNHLLTALYRMRYKEEFLRSFDAYQKIEMQDKLLSTDHLKHLYFKYKITHQCNYYFLQGEFKQGVLFIPTTAIQLDLYRDKMTHHHLCLFYYKFACMYFGAGLFQESILWLNKIINSSDSSVRNDIQCFTRILTLICYFELKNEEMMEYYIRSTYRFLIKKDDLFKFQKRIMQFLREMKNIEILTSAFEQLRAELVVIRTIPFEKRVFQYFDIISWLESKIYAQPLEKIIQEKSNN